MATATSLFIILAVALITMSAAAVAQSPRPSPGPSTSPRGMPPAPYVGISPGPAIAMPPAPSVEISPGPEIAMPPESMGPTPASDDCLSYVLNMSDCLSYVQVGSNVTVPDKPCCPELAGLLESHPLCLCELVGSASSYGVNVTKALSLPHACGLPNLPLSLCPGVPAGPPVGSPETGAVSAPPAGSIAEPPISLGTSTIAGSSSLVFLLVLAISFLRAHF